FDIEFYKNSYEDLVKISDENFDFILHYIRFGKDEGRVYKNSIKSKAEDEQVDSDENNKLEHYTFIDKNNMEILMHFDEVYYLEHNPDIKKSGINAYEHYMTYGWKERRNPNDWFDVNFYLNQYSDIKEASMEPFSHYLLYGQYEGRLAKQQDENTLELNYEELMDFGYKFYGPVFSVFFQFIDSYVKNNNIKKLYFLAREGYFLKQMYERLASENFVKDIDTEYLLVSRAFLFRLLLGTDKDVDYALKARFNGTLKSLLEDRFALNMNEIDEFLLTQEELSMPVLLPENMDEIKTFLSAKVQTHSLNFIQESFNAYEKYLNELGFLKEEQPCVVDFGYNGTIQKTLSKLFMKDLSGVYFINSNKSNQEVLGDNICEFISCFREGVTFGEGYELLEKSLVFEGLLTSPEGQLRNILNINGNVKSFHGIHTTAQHKFHYLDAIVEGAIQFMVEMNKSNVDSQRFTEEVEKIFSVNVKNIDHSLLKLLELDDKISGFNVINLSIVIN
ncbi:MAG: hypothetical protein IE909_10585, partial [Campylobacterales bacterium]|nr:hypothetical protein [Campylobacterales bacterium]